MKNLSLFLIFFTTISHAQISPIKNHIIIRDIVGDVQVRNAKVSSWKPLLAGQTIVEKSFIRLNTKESSVVISYPDGSSLRLLGLGSYFFDQISQPYSNIYHNKILVFSGRWFYNSSTNFPTRFIANTDITTSVVEQGAGGGFFIRNTNEFFLLKGRGLISYRQKDINAIVLDERQYINFNIFDGFFKPQLLTDEILAQYMIYPEASEKPDIKKNISYTPNVTNSSPTFSYQSTPYIFTYNNFPNDIQESHNIDDIQAAQLIHELSFPKRIDRDPSIILNQQEIKEDIRQVFKPKEPPKKIVIPKQLLESINIGDLQTIAPTVTEKPKPSTNSTRKPKKTMPTRQRQQRVEAPKTQAPIEESYEEPKEELDTNPPQQNIEDLLDQIGESFSKEKTTLKKPAQISKPKILIQEKNLPVQTRPTPPRRRPKPVEEEPEDTTFKPMDGFFNRNLDSDAYKQHDGIQIDSIDDILDSELAGLLSM